jgi:hypothetical protein
MREVRIARLRTLWRALKSYGAEQKKKRTKILVY